MAIPLRDNISSWLEQLSNMSREQLANLQQASNFAVNRAIELQQEAVLHLQTATNTSLEFLKSSKDTVGQGISAQADHLSQVLDVSITKLQTALNDLRAAVPAAEIHMPQLPQLNPESVGQSFQSTASAAKETFSTWSTKSETFVQQQTGQAQQHLAELWQDVLLTADKVQQLVLEAQGTVVQKFQQAAHSIKSSQTTPASVEKNAKQQKKKQKQTSVQTASTPAPQTTTRNTFSLPIKTNFALPERLTSATQTAQGQVTKYVTHVNEFVQSTVETASGQLHTLKQSVADKTKNFSVAVPDVKLPAAIPSLSTFLFVLSMCRKKN